MGERRARTGDAMPPGSGTPLMSATTWRVKAAAARLRLTTDRKLGKRSPQWVRELAALEIGTDEAARLAYRTQVGAARSRIIEDSRRGQKTPLWIIAVASMELGDGPA
ncbi:hypothetical protein SAT01_07050 [Sinomonas atrocyanea]|nr:hypothetical protein SAT01_07050 [Sinomonas atrocyanea]GGG69612.1 hypothetical protein GCM10007172_22200 [Sinomonas atrocyanea]